MLWEEGRLGLADPVERFLPQLGNRRVAVLNERVLAGQGPIETVPAARSITMLDLMRHTSGLTYGGRGTTAVHALYPASSNAAGASARYARRSWSSWRPRRCCISPERSGTMGFRSTSSAWWWKRSPARAWARSCNSDCSARSAWWTPASRCRRTRWRASPVRCRATPIPARRSRCRIAPRRCASNAAAAGWRPPRSITSASRKCCWAAACLATRASWAARRWRRCGPTA